MRSLIFLAAAATLALGAPTPADACSFPNCGPHQFVPNGGTLPANADVLAWSRGWGVATDAGSDTGKDFVFTCTADDGGEEEVVFDLEDGLIRPHESLREGATCRIEPTAPCDAASFGSEGPPGGPADFTVGPPAPLPTALGALTVEPVEQMMVQLAHGASCNAPYSACARRVTLVPAEEAEPWMDAFLFSTQVDGADWKPRRDYNHDNELGASYLGRGHELVFHVLDDDPHVSADSDLAPGTHTVVMRATLPGTDVVLETPPVTVDLSCADTDGGGSCSATVGRARSGPGAWLPALALAALAIRRRRR